MPKDDFRYLDDESHFLDQVGAVWGTHVSPEAKLRVLYDALPSDDEKNLFLRVGSFYRYLVKEGSFRFDVDEWNRTMPFIDGTYKYVALFALVEALEIPSKHLDFFQWLQRNHPSLTMPPDAGVVEALEPLYCDYKREYGSTHAAVTFFSRLDASDQTLIQQRLQIDNKELSLKKLAQILYDIRSQWVHQAKFVLWFSNGVTVGHHHDDVLTSSLSMSDLTILFEHGFLKRFGWTGVTQQAPETRP
jgi:hypothetical protein